VQRKYAGIPDAILAAPDLLDLLLPRLRADFELLESYQYSPGGPLACPISVFGGRQDRTVTPAELHAWDQHSSAPTVVRMVDGPHLFLQPQRAVLLAAIQEDLALGCAAPGSAA
jgi:surfactin synthase thioesterase subunit